MIAATLALHLGFLPGSLAAQKAGKQLAGGYTAALIALHADLDLFSKSYGSSQVEPIGKFL